MKSRVLKQIKKEIRDDKDAYSIKESHKCTKYKIIRTLILSFLIISMISPMILNFPFFQPATVLAATKNYGIVVADKNGAYTFYDWNTGTGIPGVETTSTGNVMVPLYKLINLMPQIKYSYNTSTQKATVKNVNNGKKVVFTKNSKYFYYYSSTKAKAVKKEMIYKMYISSKSSSVMVPMSALNWVMASTSGFKYYGVSDMQTAGYDTSVYSGLLVYNPYAKITTIPVSTSVTGIAKTIKITIPEGYSVSQIFNLLVKKGVCTSTALLYKACNEYEFSKDRYPLYSQIIENENRCFRLEGYLYPDTYEFYRLMKPQDAIGKFLRNTEAKITQTDRKKAESLGYTMDEILTIASLIEKETGDSAQMPKIASVIYNRMKVSMKLQFDTSINYVEWYIKPYISGDVNRYNSYYNTYKCSALPAGPICNPGKTAIHAALNPASSDYLYFCSDSKGNYYYAATYEEHKANLVTAGLEVK